MLGLLPSLFLEPRSCLTFLGRALVNSWQTEIFIFVIFFLSFFIFVCLFVYLFNYPNNMIANFLASVSKQNYIYGLYVSVRIYVFVNANVYLRMFVWNIRTFICVIDHSICTRSSILLSVYTLGTSSIHTPWRCGHVTRPLLPTWVLYIGNGFAKAPSVDERTLSHNKLSPQVPLEKT